MPDTRDSWTDSIAQDAPTDEHTVRKLYDEFAAHYNDTLDQWHYSAPDVAADYLSLHVPRSRAVLDAGCGTGLTGASLAAAGYTRITGSDLSPASVAIARESHHYQHVHVLNLGAPLPFDTAQFGGAMCIGVFSYIPDLEPVLRELLRVVMPGGVLVFTQRDDLYKKRGNAELFDRMHKAGGFEPLVATSAKPYLPGNPNFAEHIGVRYFVWQKQP
jgi:predicted TPR repeat methyltransferase